ncbi:MAG: hypothetical protein ABW217_15350 [Polyangiaceae bacterium]
MSEIKDGWLADPAALVGEHEPANDLVAVEVVTADVGTEGLGSGERGRARGPVRAGPRLDEAPTREVISRKEQARLFRRQAYQRAKQLRATDPRHLALKEALKQRRRAAYQTVKAKRKAVAAEQKSAAKAERAKERSFNRKASSESLMQHVKRGADLEKLPLRRRPPSDE